jgi:mRNA-degrading endonuclease toxin of MazEF toxin-antitoxin module
MIKQGDIVLVPVPFTDLSSTKRRPVIVISRDDYQAATSDMLVAAMTSNLTAVPYSFVLEQRDLVVGKLKRPSRVRVDKVYSLAQSIAVRTFGHVSDATLDRIRQSLSELCRN